MKWILSYQHSFRFVTEFIFLRNYLCCANLIKNWEKQMKEFVIVKKIKRIKNKFISSHFQAPTSGKVVTWRARTSLTPIPTRKWRHEVPKVFRQSGRRTLRRKSYRSSSRRFEKKFPDCSRSRRECVPCKDVTLPDIWVIKKTTIK